MYFNCQNRKIDVNSSEKSLQTPPPHPKKTQPKKRREKNPQKSPIKYLAHLYSFNSLLMTVLK